MMLTRELGQGLRSSAIGLGCMSMSGQYGAFDDKESAATLRHAVEAGVTLFDTADIYGPFANEALVGRELAHARDRLLISTKFGLVRASTGQHIGVSGRPDYVRWSCDLSLQRLGTDRIDIYWQHRVDPEVPIEDTVGAMSELVKAGKVRFIGLCEAGPQTIRRAHAVHPLSAVQHEYSLWARDVEAEILPTLRELGVGLVAYSPLGRGFLTGRIADPGELGEDDYRRRDPRFKKDAFAHNRALVRRIEVIATKMGCSPGQLALAWVLAQGDDIVPIPGTKRRKYLDENLGALKVKFEPQQANELSELLRTEIVEGERYADMTSIGR
jgi:aryl-alcohol dehydrogenase-like predicted oxidoreductase